MEYTIAGDYDKAKDCHRNQEAVLLENLTSLQAHYRQSFLDQQSHFQIRKDEIINQVIDPNLALVVIYKEQSLICNIERSRCFLTGVGRSSNYPSNVGAPLGAKVAAAARELRREWRAG